MKDLQDFNTEEKRSLVQRYESCGAVAEKYALADELVVLR